MAIKRVTKRWLINSFAVILVILVSINIAAVFIIRSYYYNGVAQSVYSRAKIILTQMQNLSSDSARIDFGLRNMVESFSDREYMELMILDVRQNVLMTSSGFAPEEGASMPDVSQALSSPNGEGEYRGRLDSEPVLAYSLLVTLPGSGSVVVRLVVSLTLVDRQILLTFFTVAGVSAAILLFVLFSSSYFINSIVKPVGEVSRTARRIAQGDFSIRLQKKNDDEIGELCDVINYMAAELSAAEKVKNDFISSVSHELRTPMTAIKGWVETLSQDAGDPQTRAKGMKVILGETDRLSDMVEELLDFSRIQSGRMTLMLERIDILAELGDAVLMFAERAKREDVRIEYDEPQDIIPVMGDKNRLRQVFINVIDNALKYSGQGGLISVGVRREPNHVRIIITDNGTGIPTEDLPNVKKKFYKGASSRRGSGIGLAVSDEIIQMHAGELNIMSKVGLGTTVSITLPLAQSRENTLQVSEEPEGSGAEPLQDRQPPESIP